AIWLRSNVINGPSTTFARQRAPRRKAFWRAKNRNHCFISDVAGLSFATGDDRRSERLQHRTRGQPRLAGTREGDVACRLIRGCYGRPERRVGTWRSLSDAAWLARG